MQLVVTKAKEYVASGLPAGAAFERTAPELRKVYVYPDDVVVAWLDGGLELSPSACCRRLVKGIRGQDSEKPRRSCAWPITAEEPAPGRRGIPDVDLESMPVDDLNALIPRASTDAMSAL